jgi:hypothetical protein
VLSRTTAWQIFVDDNEIMILYPSEREHFLQVMEPLVEAKPPNYYLRFYSYGRHCAHFVRFDETNNSRFEFHTIENQSGMNMYDDMPRMLKGASESSERFEREIMHQPLNAPLYVINDTLYIINPVNQKLESFTISGEHLQDRPQDISNDKTWNNTLLHDNFTGKIYSMHIKNGYIQLTERKPDDLRILTTIPIPSYPYIERVQMENSKIFFLYKDFTSQEFKQLYCLRL